MDKDDSRWGLALLIVVTLALRVAVICLEWGTFAGDQDSYGRLAVNWAMTGTFGFPIINQPTDQSAPAAELTAATPVRATAYRPPMYPALLVPLVWNGQLNFEAVAALHVILGLITVLVVFFVADRMQMSAPWIPAMAVACDPILLRGSQLLMTETLITCLAVSVWAIYLILVRPKLSEVGREIFGIRLSIRLAFLMGALLGMSVLTRPTMVPWAILVIVTLSLRSTSAGNRVSMITAAVLMLAAFSITWMARNKRELGQPIWTTTHSGYTLLLANNPSLYRHFEEHGPDRNWKAREFDDLWSQRRTLDLQDTGNWNNYDSIVGGGQAVSSITPTQNPAADIDELADDELADDELAQQVAMATIRDNPLMFLKSCVYRVAWLWALYPNQVDEDHQWLIGIWYGLWFIMAVLGMIRLWGAWTSRVWMMPLLLVLTLTAIHAVYWSNMRMRAPLMPIVYMVACWPLLKTKVPTRLTP